MADITEDTIQHIHKLYPDWSDYELLVDLFPGWSYDWYDTCWNYPVDQITLVYGVDNITMELPLIAVHYGGTVAACRGCMKSLFECGPYCDHHLHHIRNGRAHSYTTINVALMNVDGRIVMTSYDRNYRIPRVGSSIQLPNVLSVKF